MAHNLIYGFAREPNEGQWYLMKARESNPRWFDAIAAYNGRSCKEDGFMNPERWNKKNFPLYSVLESDVTKIDYEEAEKLLEAKD